MSLPSSIKDPAKLEKIQQLRMKINEAKKLNNKAVIDEEKKQSDPNYDKQERKKKWLERKTEKEEENKFKGVDPEKDYLNITASSAEFQAEHKKKKHDTFGWDVFNEDSLFRAYKKRVKDLPHYTDVYEKAKGEGEDQAPNEERLQKLVDDIASQEEKRSKFSRRRAFYDDEDINYINDRNRVFNQKLERHFGKYASEIKLSLERGTAM